LADEHIERQMEQAILSRVVPFLLEMGGMFSGSPASSVHIFS
jgi:predicted nuclease of restriction endonuclease-like (RecB) superfamily